MSYVSHKSSTFCLSSFGRLFFVLILCSAYLSDNFIFAVVHIVVLVVALVGRWTRDRKVAGSTPCRGAIKSTRSTQPSIPPG